MIKNNTFFVTGTDTDSGKTFITCSLLYKANKLRLSTFAIKPLASGCNKTLTGLENSDALFIKKEINTPASYSDINFISFESPIAPHLAAKDEGVEINSKEISLKCKSLIESKSAEFVLIEGAGGWRVPLNENNDYFGNVAIKMKIPVILVVGMKLGCINHAILSSEVILNDKVPIAGWIATQVDPNMSHVQENIHSLKKLIKVPFLGFVPFLNKPNVKEAANYININALL